MQEPYLFGGFGRLFSSSEPVTPVPSRSTTSTERPSVAANTSVPEIHEGKQGKHQIGHNNYKAGRSVLTVDPEELASRAGTGQQVGKVPVGQAGSKERVNFGKIIGNWVDENTGQSLPTTNGIIHYDGGGKIHIVPSAP